MPKDRVLLTMGDPNGIGPEVLLKSLSRLAPNSLSRLLIVGDRTHIEGLSQDLNISPPPLEYLHVDAGMYPPAWGQISAHAGSVAYTCLEAAMRQLCKGQGSALVTAPIHKKAARMAGFGFAGQTEFVSSYFPSANPAMGFLSDSLKLVLATVHVPLSEVPFLLSSDRIITCSELLRNTLIDLGIPVPRIALCGLNPHASDSGLFGQEEQNVITPALQTLQSRHGIESFTGPHPSDSLFTQKSLAKQDGIVAMYHDQGLIPFKLLAFNSGVNTTLGLPVVRTSPTHGTAFDIAGQGTADSSSMQTAIEWAIHLADIRLDGNTCSG